MWDELPRGWNPWYGRRIRPAWNAMLGALYQDGPMERAALIKRGLAASDVLPGTLDTLISSSVRAGALCRLGQNGRELDITTWLLEWLGRADRQALRNGPGLQEAEEAARARANA